MMKERFLTLVVALLACSCQVTQQAQTSSAIVNANANQQSNENLAPEKSANVEKAKVVDDARFSAAKIKRTKSTDKFSLSINVEYPQMKSASKQSEIEFNRFVKKQVDAQIADFKKFLLEKNKEAKFESKDEYEINLSHDFQFVSDDFVSVLMSWNGFSGYLNMDYFPSTINFDLNKGKTVSLSELFEPNSKYLEKISELSLENLKKTCLMCPCKDGVNAGEPLPDGVVNEVGKSGPFDLAKATAAKKENFSNWSVTPNGLKITFGEYEVGPGCIGIISITIPFKDLQPILRKDFNFN